MYIYVYTYKIIYVRIFPSQQIRTYIEGYICIRTYECMHVCMYAWMSVCMSSAADCLPCLPVCL